jgi:hypothetical protein
MISEINSIKQLEKNISNNLIAVIFFIEKDSDICNELLGRIQLELIPHLREIEGTILLKISSNCKVDFFDHFNINEVPSTIVFFKGQQVSFFEKDKKGTMYKTDRFIGNDPELPNKLFRFILHLYRRFKEE